MSATDEHIEWLSANTLEWSLEVNPERGVYEKRADYLADTVPDEDDDIGALLAAPNLFEARAYPSTPVGFVQVRDTSAEAALRRLREGLS